MFEKYECDTPTHSDDFSSASYPSSTSDIGSLSSPWKGGLFIIRDPQTGLVIALKEGTLGLFPNAHHRGGGSRWQCVENERLWLGFKNAVSGTYIGHNNNGQFIAQARKHND